LQNIVKMDFVNLLGLAGFFAPQQSAANSRENDMANQEGQQGQSQTVDQTDISDSAGCAPAWMTASNAYIAARRGPAVFPDDKRSFSKDPELASGGR
jgi:hypothetical protein